jgi:predicted dehydrogenase
VKNKITCAIIGCGYMGEIRHRMVQQHPNFTLSMICDTDSQIIVDEKDLTLVRDPMKVIESNVQAVFVCTPNHLIPDLTVQCLDRGKHVFCEKPPGRTLDDIQHIQEAERKNQGTKLMFGFNHRYHPGVMRAKSIVDSDRLGKVVALRGLYGKSGGFVFSFDSVSFTQNDFKEQTTNYDNANP